MTNHLEGAGATLNRKSPRVTGFKCGGWRRPCRRMECNLCAEIRRQYFVEAGTFMVKKLGLLLHCTITLHHSEFDDPWLRLPTLSILLTDHLNKKIAPFIRTLALGRSRRTPHVHYLIRPSNAETLEALIREHFPDGSRAFIDSQPAYDVPGLLDYHFRQNFLPTATDPNRIKGLRLISGSRGVMTFGFPKAPHWKRLQAERENTSVV